MKKIGLTGNIGSGKTTIASLFEVFGIAVFNADNEAKRLMSDDKILKNELIVAFGKEVFVENKLNRKYLADLAFSDELVLKKLNSLVHPFVQHAFDKWSDEQISPYVIKEAAILFESNNYQSLDAIICVTCPEDIRLERLLKRDNISKKQLIQRINNQWQEEKKKSMSDYIVINDNSCLVTPQVLKIHNTLK
jgi:dephospho-CoA kinase